jgi:exodeoxyribonuclease-3
MIKFSREPEKMKIASFNVNSIRVRLDIVLDWLKKESPDVLCLQETKCPDGAFPVEAFQKIHYHPVYRGEKSYNGVAILSKGVVKNVRMGFDEHETDGTRLIACRLRKISIVNVYVPQGFQPLSEQFRNKLNWLQRLYEYFEQNFRPDDLLVWVGDFNVAPEPIDVYDPDHLLGSVGYHPDEHEALLRLREWGFVDVFRMHQPQPGHFTFWDYRVRNAFSRKMGWRVDHIWATQPLAEKSVRSWIDTAPRLKERPSDHTVIAAEFKI